MKPDEFTLKYAHTLQTDPQTNIPYIKIHLTDLSDLAYMQQGLINALQLLTCPGDNNYDNEQVQNAMYWLCKILLDSYPQDELRGLRDWLEN